ncbi:MAG: hypothetical protein WCA11_06390, partial [Terracidiphilus sp.]
MPDGYQLPAIILTALLLPAFAQLFLRSRETRTLMWFLGFLFALLRMVQLHGLGFGDFSDSASHPWITAAGLCCMLVSSLLFLASLSPLTFRLGKVRVLYIIPFAIPLIAYAILLFGVYHGVMPASLAFFAFPALGALSLFVGCFWAFAKGSMPTWLGLALCIAMGGASLWICVEIRGPWPLVFVECALHFTTALLVFFVFRRISPGSILSALGFLAWSLNIGLRLPAAASDPALHLYMLRAVSMGKVAAAVGMILLVLEDQLALKQTAQDREHRARKELEAYSRVVLSRRRVEDFDRQANLICQTVVASSRFTQAALILLQSSGQYRLAGAAGIDDAPMSALEALATRIPAAGFLAPGSLQPAAVHSQSFN